MKKAITWLNVRVKTNRRWVAILAIALGAAGGHLREQRFKAIEARLEELEDIRDINGFRGRDFT